MTIAATIAPGRLTVEAAPLEAVTFDFYRNVHKGIRRELFGVTQAWGSVDPADVTAVESVYDRMRNLVKLLVTHAEHEDEYVQPWVDQYVPTVGDALTIEHQAIEAQLAGLEIVADRALGLADDKRSLTVHRLYLGWASFTAEFLQHIAYEEFEVMPALSSMLPVDKLVGIEHDIVSSIPPEDMPYGLSLMLPAMNVDERSAFFAGMQANAPAPVFAGVSALAEQVLTADDWTQVKARVGIA
jgi:hypothetical protein